MKSMRYRCLVDGFSAVAKGQEVIVTGDSAQTTDGTSLMIKTQYVKEHPDEFQLIGEEEEQKPPVAEPSSAKPQYLVVCNIDSSNMFATEKEALEYAESHMQAGITYVAKITGRMKVEMKKVWEV